MDLISAAEAGFKGQDLEALRAYCDRLGVQYPKNASADQLRKKLAKAMGEYHELSTPADPLSSIDNTTLGIAELTRLNLRDNGRWEGRRRTIQLHRAMAHESTYPQFIAWGELHCYIPYGEESDIPYPIWNVLLATAGKRLVRKRRVDDEGRIFFEESWVPTQRFMYSDMGDTPGTEHLPIDMIDMVRRLYDLSDKFKGYDVRQYRELCSRLNIDVPTDWTAEDMLNRILTLIGVQDSAVSFEPLDFTAGAATG